MESLPRRYSRRSKVTSKIESADADDLAIVRQRMRHLAPWNIEPLPIRQLAVSTPVEPLAAGQREHQEELARQILADHIRLATDQSAMN